MKEENESKPSEMLLYIAYKYTLGTFVWAYALFILWGWFVVPAGGPSLGIWHIAGLSTVAKLVGVPPVKIPGDGLVTKAIFTLLVPLAFLGLGWVFHAMM